MSNSVAIPERVRVKVCGITRLDDALAAARLGVDALGFVFYPKSHRRIDARRAAEIIAALPPFVVSVGLFLDASREEIDAVLDTVTLDLLQFHGDESPEFCESFGRRFIKAVPMRIKADVRDYARRFDSACALLLDSHGGGVIGGSGQAFDWSQVPKDLDKPIVLAGGLGPSNVAEAVRAVRPFAVDVSSGVEIDKGIKDAVLIERFLRELPHNTESR